MKEPQKRFRLAMNDLLSTPQDKMHVFEIKNDYKDYPCECGARDNRLGTTCWRYKANIIKDSFLPLITNNTKDMTKEARGKKEPSWNGAGGAAGYGTCAQCGGTADYQTGMRQCRYNAFGCRD